MKKFAPLDFKKNKKGISPVVAAVLLIAIAVTIGVMVSIWVTHWVTTQIGSTSIECAVNTVYVIDSARFNVTGFNDTLLIKITNKGSQRLYGFAIMLDNGTSIRQYNSSSKIINQGGISSDNKLLRGQSAYIRVHLNSTAKGARFGHSMTTSSRTVLRIMNDACPAVTAETTTVT